MMESLINESETSAGQTSSLPFRSSQESNIYNVDSSLQQGSSTSISPQNAIPGSIDSFPNMVHVPKDSPDSVGHERVESPQNSLRNSKCSTPDMLAGFENTFCVVKCEVEQPSISPDNVIHDFKPHVTDIHNSDGGQGQHLGFPSELNIHSETQQTIQIITSQSQSDNSVEHVPLYCDMKPLIGENYLASRLTECSVGIVHDEILDIKQPVIFEFTAQAAQPESDLSCDILNGPVDSGGSGVVLAHTGHVYEDIKPGGSDTGLAHMGHVYKDLKPGGSETGLAHMGHVFEDLKPGGSMTGLARTGHVYEDLKPGGSETGLAHTGHVYEDIIPGGSEMGLAHTGHVYEDLKPGGSETVLAHTGHVYEDLKPGGSVTGLAHTGHVYEDLKPGGSETGMAHTGHVYEDLKPGGSETGLAHTGHVYEDIKPGGSEMGLAHTGHVYEDLKPGGSETGLAHTGHVYEDLKPGGSETGLAHMRHVYEDIKPGGSEMGLAHTWHVYEDLKPVGSETGQAHTGYVYEDMKPGGSEMGLAHTGHVYEDIKPGGSEMGLARTGPVYEDMKPGGSETGQAHTGYVYEDLKPGGSDTGQGHTGHVYEDIKPGGSEMGLAHTGHVYEDLKPGGSETGQAHTGYVYEDLKPGGSDRGQGHTGHVYEDIKPGGSEMGLAHTGHVYEDLKPGGSETGQAHTGYVYEDLKPGGSDTGQGHTGHVYEDIKPGGSEMGLAHTGHVYEDLKPGGSDTGQGHTGHVYEDIKSGGSEMGLAHTGHVYVDLKPRGSETGQAHTGHVYEDLKPGGSETGLAHTGYVYKDLKPGGSDTGLAHTGYVYEDLKPGGSEMGLAHTGHVYEDLKPGGSEMDLAHTGHVYEDLKPGGSETGMAHTGHVYEDLKPGGSETGQAHTGYVYEDLKPGGSDTGQGHTGHVYEDIKPGGSEMGLAHTGHVYEDLKPGGSDMGQGHTGHVYEDIKSGGSEMGLAHTGHVYVDLKSRGSETGQAHTGHVYEDLKPGGSETGLAHTGYVYKDLKPGGSDTGLAHTGYVYEDLKPGGSEMGLAHTGHVYEDLKPGGSETGMAHTGHVYEDLKPGGSEMDLAHTGHVYEDLKPGGSETGMAHTGHVYEDLKPGGSEIDLAHTGHVYEDLKPGGSEIDLAHTGHVYEDLKPGGSEMDLAHTGHVYQEMKPMVFEYHAPTIEIEPNSEIGSHSQSQINLGIQFDIKVEEHFSDSGRTLTGSPHTISQCTPGVPDNQGSPGHNLIGGGGPVGASSNESMMAISACSSSKPHPGHAHFATYQVQGNQALGTKEHESGGLVVEQFQEIAAHNRQPETIILDLNNHDVEERVSKHNKSLKLKKFKKKLVEMNLACEWEECEEVSDDLNKFINHITDHIDSNLEEYAQDPDQMACNWRHCGYETQRGICDILRHVYFHAFHVKLKCLGIQMIIDNNLHACRTDGSSRNLIPELPESLVCGWVNCGHICENAEYFYRHVDMHADSAPLDNFKCFWEGCTVKVGNRTRLRDHLRSHTQEKVIACPTCGGLFSNRCKFSDHLRRQGPMDTLCFQCSHCNKKYTTERLLRDHMRVHVNHYKCPFCDMTCPNPSTLNSHIKYRHSDEKPYQCEHCNHKTKSAADLRRHMEVHNEKKMFNCEFPGCNYSHKTFHGVSYHYRILHQNPKKYLCHMCQATFERGGHLTRHLKKAHKFKWPSGHSRFRYRQQEDGTMALQMVRYESVELATHFIDKDGEHLHSGPRDGHSAGFNPVPAYQSEAPETPITNETNRSSNADANKSGDPPADVFLTEADLSYNLEMLGEVALHGSPAMAKSKNTSRVESSRAKSTRFSDLPSPIHGSAFRPNVAVHREASNEIVTLSSNLLTSPEKSYELTTAIDETNKTPPKEQSLDELDAWSNSRRQTNSTPWKVTFNNSPSKRRRSAGRSQSVNKQAVEAQSDKDTGGAAKQNSGRSPRLKRKKRFS